MLVLQGSRDVVEVLESNFVILRMHSSSIEGIDIYFGRDCFGGGNIRRISNPSGLEHFWPEFITAIYTGARNECRRENRGRIEVVEGVKLEIAVKS